MKSLAFALCAVGFVLFLGVLSWPQTHAAPSRQVATPTLGLAAAALPAALTSAQAVTIATRQFGAVVSQHAHAVAYGGYTETHYHPTWLSTPGPIGQRDGMALKLPRFGGGIRTGAG